MECGVRRFAFGTWSVTYVLIWNCLSELLRRGCGEWCCATPSMIHESFKAWPGLLIWNDLNDLWWFMGCWGWCSLVSVQKLTSCTAHSVEKLYGWSISKETHHGECPIEELCNETAVFSVQWCFRCVYMSFCRIMSLLERQPSVAVGTVVLCFFIFHIL